ncbi:MAG TPA: hypothetical protein VG537_11340, partial [Candidatus Kapabacteria bacterium]|nr:hypothetical protein [Candidatus Kapabacteria bacterium]
MRLERLAILLLAISGIVFLAISASSLYYLPVADSYRWYGDETWMMLGWKSLISHGTASVPIALSSILQQSPGLLLSSGWISALFYGVPQLFLPSTINIVSAGRTISFLFGIATLFFLGWYAIRLRVSAIFVVLAIILLLSSTSFVYATHSARYDVIIGFTILTFLGYFALRADGIHTFSEKGAFFFGLCTVLLAITIGPHLEVLLLPVSIYISWYFRILTRLSTALWMLAGASIALGILSGMYVLGNGYFSIAEINDNQFESVLGNFPIRHLFSFSAQSHQLWARGYYLWHEAEAFAFILPLIFISEIGLTLERRPHRVARFLSIALTCVLWSAIFLQSTLPYYQFYILPLASLTFAVHLQQWRTNSVVRWSARIAGIAASILVLAIFLPRLDRAGKIGRKINEANIAAIQAAFEETSRSWPHMEKKSASRPLVLAQAPAIAELLRDPTVRIMSESFLFFPSKNQGLPDSVIAREHVDYIIDYGRPMTSEYDYAVHQMTPIFLRTGSFLDRNIDYFHPTSLI